MAGSERLKDTGAEGARAKEASSINQSLSELANVINDLVEANSSKGPKHIRYRNSKLTYLLKDSLGGNSKTTVICNVNPHIQAHKETLSTLRFAHRAKMIKNKAVVNEENSNPEYWKNKFYELQRAQTMPTP